MPRNRRPQAREEKRGEIVAAARDLFIDVGYESTSMGRIAKAAGVSANTIYWYYADKDDVLVAVLNAVMTDVWVEFQSVATEPASERLMWVVRQLQRMSRLVNTVHTRAEGSPMVAEWHNNFHLLASSLFHMELEQAGTSAEALDAEVMIGVFAIEGMLMHPLGEEQQRAICDTLGTRWIPKPHP